MNTPHKSNLAVFADTLIAQAKFDRQIVVVTSDSRVSAHLMAFSDIYPYQSVEVGIAEQNLVGTAAGLASTGKKVFAVSPAAFLTSRAVEQIKNDVSFSNNPVTLVGISAGVSYGSLGATHHSLHDLALLRAIPNIRIVVPCDNVETTSAVQKLIANPEPTYLRLGKYPIGNLPSVAEGFSLGQARIIRNGLDAAFIAYGETVHCAYEAAVLLGQFGIDCKVISMHTVKPLDLVTLYATACSCRAVVTVEEHSVNGGLGEASALAILELGASCLFRSVALPDEYLVAGSQSEILDHYGISKKRLVDLMVELLGP